MFREELEPLRPYVPPKSWRMAAEGTDENNYAKLTSNELSFGPLPEAEAALAEALTRANRYPDSHASRLRQAVADANPGSETSNVLVGNGSSEVIFNVLQLLPGGDVVFGWPSFSMYPTTCAILGMNAREVPLRNEAMDLEAMLRTISGETRAVILCNPNNPSGTCHPLDRVREFAGELPKNVILIVDEAYVEFVEDPAYKNSHTLALESENVVVARTFSKAHGLAGLRVGYGVASKNIADYAERVRFPVSVNLAAQAAATASMLAREKVEERARFVIRERSRLEEAFQKASLEFIPSQGNFIMVRFAAADFEKSGVLAREGEALGYPGWSRVTVGNSSENNRVIEAL